MKKRTRCLLALIPLLLTLLWGGSYCWLRWRTERQKETRQFSPPLLDIAFGVGLSTDGNARGANYYGYITHPNGEIHFSRPLAELYFTGMHLEHRWWLLRKFSAAEMLCFPWNWRFLISLAWFVFALGLPMAVVIRDRRKALPPQSGQ